VPEVFPTARTYHGGFRVSSAELERDLEEDISIVPEGIKDFGVHDLDDPLDGKRTPIGLIMEHVFEVPVEDIAARSNREDFDRACDWLRARLPGGEDLSDEHERPPLTLAEWLTRDLPEPDCLMGHWLTTTSRVVLAADTGLGKTLFAMSLCLHAAAKTDFLQWQAHRACRVLYIDGEMSRRLLKRRIVDAVARIGEKPVGFHALSHEDIEGFAPLNTPKGQACIERLIKQIGGVIVFDSVMCLLIGDMKDEESWQKTMPWVRSLTKRNIGQIWINHTGHDASRGYGTKTREWQMDTVLHLEAANSSGADVSFTLEFRKARERTPDTRDDFRTALIELIGNTWMSQADDTGKKANVSPLGQKFLGALYQALPMRGDRRVTMEAWHAECVRIGLLDPGKAHSARTVFSRYRRELIAADRIACNAQYVWPKHQK
jgi:hypothetical protein